MYVTYYPYALARHPFRHSCAAYMYIYIQTLAASRRVCFALARSRTYRSVTTFPLSLSPRSRRACTRHRRRGTHAFSSFFLSLSLSLSPSLFPLRQSLSVASFFEFETTHCDHAPAYTRLSASGKKLPNFRDARALVCPSTSMYTRVHNTCVCTYVRV